MKTAITIVIVMVMVTGSLSCVVVQAEQPVAISPAVQPPVVISSAEQPPAIPAEEEPEVLTRGPVNEAFAQPVNMEDQTGLVAPTEPPANIEEVPPADRPSGDQFVWVPGYWAWDSDRNGYIWVSGCWRAAPPGMYWVPGYWVRAAGGWQWVAGFWAPVANQEIEYLPPPPAMADIEPPGPAPSPDRLWVPPCWFWYHGQYIRRPGYWIMAQADWVWVPSHYVWTPRGYVFVNGHWDYSLSRRGVLFAPIYFPRHSYERPRFSYSLSIAVDIGNLEFSLFSCPRYNHYYFGDYYDDVYIGIGIFPWYECERRHTWYDPIYVHDRWRHRAEPRWEENERHEYDRRRADRDLRPPRTYREMESKMSRTPEAQRRSFEMAVPMNRVVTRKTSTMKFEQIKPDARQQMSSHSAEVHKFGEDRSRWESQGVARKGQPVIEKVPSNERKETASPVERKGPEMKPTERKDTAPVEKKGPVTPAEQQKQTKEAPREKEQVQSDKVKVSNPPVVGKKEGGFFKKSPPSKPAEEQKTEVKETPKGKDAQKGSDARGNKDTQKGNDARSEKDTQKGNDARGDKDTQKSNDSRSDKSTQKSNDGKDRSDQQK